MGKGDLRSRRGKIHRGTSGNRRLRKKEKAKKRRKGPGAGDSAG
jgi:ribosomal small subunit protein bTHX